jgi:SAM-dependent methyltransferase
VLDVGCGDGSATRPLAARARALTGVEPSPPALAAAVAARSPAGERYVAGTAEALPVPAGAVDVVLFLNSLHHVDDLGAALAEAARVLRPGGILYAQEPLAEGEYFALVRLVDDETGVREAAQAALRAPPAPLEAQEEVEYDTPVVHAGLAAFRERVLLADPGRAAAFDTRRAELEDGFAAAGEPDPEGVLFRQPTRVTLLRRRADPEAARDAHC